VFLAKKIVGELLSPLSVFFMLALLGLALLWFSRRERLAKLVMSTAVLLFVTLAYGWLAGPALSALEREHPPLAAVPPGIKWVVVLGGGTYSDPGLPPGARLTEATLARLVEGMRLQRQQPGLKLVVSGGPVFGAGSDAQAMSALAAELGAARESIVLDERSADTEAQALAMRELLKGEPCVLVTSAAHMRRSLAFFRKHGVHVIPAPTDYLSQVNAGATVSRFFPQSRPLRAADAAVHEYLGLAWARLTGAL
jgi:uncharacterized SAM-binding protein YcdF (DUF218 family)